MVSKPSPPKPPDPTATIAAQNAANQSSALQTAELNRINQYTPYGDLTYATTGTYPDGTPIYTQTQTLAPAQQTLLNLGNTGAISLGQTGVNMLDQIQAAYGSPISTAGGPGISTVDASQAGQDAAIRQAQDAAYRTNTQYLDPQFQQARDQLTAQLANQGIQPGSDAYNTAVQNLGRQQNAAYQSAQDAAVAAGNTEQNTLYNQQANAAQVNNQANAQFLQQLFAVRNQPLSEYAALASGSQPTQPNFAGFASSPVQPTNAAGIINQGYQNQLGYYQAQQAANPFNNLLSLGGTLGAAWIGA